MDVNSGATPVSAPQRLPRLPGSNDTLANESVMGTAGDDQLYGGKGDDWLSGGAGIDTWMANRSYGDLRHVSVEPITGLRSFEVPQGRVTLEGVEFIRFSDLLVAADDPLLLQRQQVQTTPEGVNIVGTDLPVALTGGKGADTLQGNGGDDLISGGYSGVDTAVYRGPHGDYVLGHDPETGYVTLTDQVPGRDGRDTLVNIELLRFADGDWTLQLKRQVKGTADDDSLWNGGTPSEFYGQGGDDALHGSSADVAVYRGPRSDYVIERSPLTALPIVRDTVPGRDGVDVIHGMGTLRFADGTVPYEVPPLKRQVDGSAAAETLFGGEDDQSLLGLGGDDFLDGAGGSDTAVFRGARSEYRIEFNIHSPWAQVVDTVAGRDGRDTLTGVEWLRFADQTLALDLTRTVTGTGKAEVLAAGDGDQVLVGLGGDDQLEGGAGVDTAVFSGPMAEYKAQLVNGATARVIDTVPGRDGRDTLFEVEWLRFSDRTVSYDSYFAEQVQAWIDRINAWIEQNGGVPASASSGMDFENEDTAAGADAADVPLAGVVQPHLLIPLTAMP